MFYYFASFALYFVFDKIKNKILANIFYNSGIKLIKYTNEWHEDNRYIIKDLLDWVIL